jgi:hypothetical protein
MWKQPYYPLRTLLEMIDEPNRSACLRLYDAEHERFGRARGSTHNHQAWPGGYHDHIEDGLNYVVLFYRADAGTGRAMPFTLSQALLAYYLHDLEKPWRFERVDGEWRNTGLMTTKKERSDFRWLKIAEWGISLDPDVRNAVQYAEGEGDDYRADKRVACELAGFVHVIDTYSARVRHDHPKVGDPWSAR